MELECDHRRSICRCFVFFLFLIVPTSARYAVPRREVVEAFRAIFYGVSSHKGARSFRKDNAYTTPFYRGDLNSSFPSILHPLQTKDGRLTSSQAYSSRIAGGYEAPPSTFRHVAHVSVMMSSGEVGLCTGTIISRRRILTAAHCFTNAQNRIDVTGTLIRSGQFSDRGATYKTKSVSILKTYNASTYQNDIALVSIFGKLPRTFKRILVSGCFGCSTKPGTLVYAAGFGQVRNQGANANKLMETKLKIQKYNVCKMRYKQLSRSPPSQFFSKKRVLCAMDMLFPDSANSAVCKGDSGGPLFLKHGKRIVQVGLTSFGTSPCSQAGAVDWFVNLDTYVPFIQQFLSKNFKSWRRIYTHPDARS